MSTFEPNDELYRELDVPRPAEEVRQALVGFKTEVAELRKKYRLLNVSVMIETPAEGVGEATMVAGGGSWGDELRVLHMAARLVGQEKKKLDEMLREVAEVVAAVKAQADEAMGLKP